MPADTPACASSTPNVVVAVRIRPPNSSELCNLNHREIIQPVDPNLIVFDPADFPSEFPASLNSRARTARPANRRAKDLKYAFDQVFGPQATQREVYEKTAKNVVSGVLEGENCTVFAYGATGAGKSHTMNGTEKSPGVIVLTLQDIFAGIEARRHESEFSLSLTYLEVYNETIRDLLSPQEARHLNLRENSDHSVVVQGLSEHSPNSSEEVFALLERGNAKRSQCATDANAQSSRSHAVLQVSIKQKTIGAAGQFKLSKLSLIDLAGSERAAVSKNRGSILKEGANINKSLLSLGNCINALAKGKQGKFIPYRDSKLTRILKDSLSGNCRTIMIAAISSSSLSAEDSHNTLKYANRAKEIKTRCQQNLHSIPLSLFHIKSTMNEFSQEIHRLKQYLQEEKAKSSQLRKILEEKEKQGENHRQRENPMEFSLDSLQEFMKEPLNGLSSLLKQRESVEKSLSEGRIRLIRGAAEISKKEKEIQLYKQYYKAAAVAAAEGDGKEIDSSSSSSSPSVDSPSHGLSRLSQEFSSLKARQEQGKLEIQQFLEKSQAICVEKEEFLSHWREYFLEEPQLGREKGNFLIFSLEKEWRERISSQNDSHSQEQLAAYQAFIGEYRLSEEKALENQMALLFVVYQLYSRLEQEKLIGKEEENAFLQACSMVPIYQAGLMRHKSDVHYQLLAGAGVSADSLMDSPSPVERARLSLGWKKLQRKSALEKKEESKENSGEFESLDSECPDHQSFDETPVKRPSFPSSKPDPQPQPGFRLDGRLFTPVLRPGAPKIPQLSSVNSILSALAPALIKRESQLARPSDEADEESVNSPSAPSRRLSSSQSPSQFAEPVLPRVLGHSSTLSGQLSSVSSLLLMSSATPEALKSNEKLSTLGSENLPAEEPMFRYAIEENNESLSSEAEIPSLPGLLENFRKSTSEEENFQMMENTQENEESSNQPMVVSSLPILDFPLTDRRPVDRLPAAPSASAPQSARGPSGRTAMGAGVLAPLKSSQIKAKSSNPAALQNSKFSSENPQARQKLPPVTKNQQGQGSFRKLKQGANKENSTLSHTAGDCEPRPPAVVEAPGSAHRRHRSAFIDPTAISASAPSTPARNAQRSVAMFPNTNKMIQSKKQAEFAEPLNRSQRKAAGKV